MASEERMVHMDFDMVSVAAITVIVYLLGVAVKAMPIDNKWIPVICGAVGGALGVLGMFIMPDFPVHDVLNAAAIGIVSGFAATGVNQMGKQLKKGAM